MKSGFWDECVIVILFVKPKQDLDGLMMAIPRVFPPQGDIGGVNIMCHIETVFDYAYCFYASDNLLKPFPPFFFDLV